MRSSSSILRATALLLGSFALSSASSSGCTPENQEYGLVCRCNATHCDEVEPVGELQPNQAAVYSTTKAGKRLERTLASFSGPDAGTAAERNVVELDTSARLQSITGFGGAFTDASAGLILLNLTSPDVRDRLLASYFGESGLRYSVGRVHIGSCDFSRRSYSLVEEGKADLTLATFALRDDRDGGDAAGDTGGPADYKLDLIKLAEEQVAAGGRGLRIYASIWSAPLWLKSCESPPNQKHGANRCDSPSFEKGALSPNDTYRDAYARYILKFVEAYEADGVALWGLTAQNEPSGNPTGNGWESMFYTPADLAEFIERHLGPVVKGKYPGMVIMTGDDQLHTVLDHAQQASIGKYIDGVAYHWYSSLAATFEDTNAILGAAGGGLQVREASERYKLDNVDGNKFLLATEACNGYLPEVLGGKHIMPGSWERGYRYSRDIIHQLNNNASGWVDWNLALDAEGGPNHAQNFVDAPIIIDREDGFYKQPMYYHIGHIARFVPPGSRRIAVKGLKDSFVGKDKVEAAAFLTPGPKAKVVVILINDRLVSSITKLFLRKATIAINYRGQTLRVSLEPHEIKTVVFDA